MDRPALQRLVGVPRSYSRASLIAARAFIDDADPEHDAVIDTSEAVNTLSLTSQRRTRPFARRVVFGSDDEDGRRVHSSELSLRPPRSSVTALRCSEHVPSPSRTLRKAAGTSHFSRSMPFWALLKGRVDRTSHALSS